MTLETDHHNCGLRCTLGTTTISPWYNPLCVRNRPQITRQQTRLGTPRILRHEKDRMSCSVHTDPCNKSSGWKEEIIICRNLENHFNHYKFAVPTSSGTGEQARSTADRTACTDRKVTRQQPFDTLEASLLTQNFPPPRRLQTSQPNQHDTRFGRQLFWEKFLVFHIFCNINRTFPPGRHGQRADVLTDRPEDRQRLVALVLGKCFV